MSFKVLTLMIPEPAPRRAKEPSGKDILSLSPRKLGIPPSRYKPSTRNASVLPVDSLILSPRSLLHTSRKQETEILVLKQLRLKQYQAGVSASFPSLKRIDSLSPTQRDLAMTLSPGQEKSAVLELLEMKWKDLPADWSLERKVIECTLNPPAHVPALTDPISKTLIVTLSKSLLGREVLKEALAHMPKARLSNAQNYSNIMRILKERVTSSNRSFKQLQRPHYTEAWATHGQGRFRRGED